ncbi:porin family protein [Marinobacter sp. SS21]|uniref:porin family protein n=1 Tax=Marinobacter sp. SS21 TaxID=2979460 RepID=UPI00232CC8A6|nr:porin family protein [Marinobacter sp. SS21]MDC0664279.1 porin family protein [Marinobacter sp. SS21]
MEISRMKRSATNKRTLMLLGLAVAAGLTSLGAQAGDMYKSGVGGAYAGLNYSFMNIDLDGLDDADVGTLSAKVGVLATPYLGVEARGGFGVDDDRIDGAELSMDNFFGGYATLNLANESPATPYAIIGFTRIELELDTVFGTFKDDESDLSYGLGVNLEMSKELSGNLEYMRYFDKDDDTIDGLSVGLTFMF